MKDDTAPATKADITMLKGDIAMLNADVKQLLDAVRNLYDANERWKDEILRHFDVVVEDIRHDLAGANRDEIESLKDGHANHERRITKLERHAGIVV